MPLVNIVIALIIVECSGLINRYIPMAAESRRS